MNLDRLTAFANAPERTRAELEQMKKNAIAKGNAEFAKMINDLLLQRFPLRAKSGSGKTPTKVSFQDRAEMFESGKEGYLWLVEQFRAYRASVLDDYLQLHRLRRIQGGGSRFARTPVELFPKGSKRAGDSKYYSALTGGWFADTNINHDDKFAALLALAHEAKLEYTVDWNFTPIGSTEQLRKHQEAVVRAQEMLAKLLRELDEV